MRCLKLLCFLLIWLNSFVSIAQINLINHTYNRETISLDGAWQYIVDPYENGFYNYRYEPFENQEKPGNGAFFTNAKRKGKADLVEYNFDLMDSLTIPGDWNTQKEKLYYYEGSLWLKKSFNYQKTADNNRVFIHFGAANYQADVYFNGKKLGRHIGGFTPFNFEVTPLIKEKDNFVIVKVDNTRKKEGVPTLNTDWWNYGGITRSVKLIEIPPVFIADYFIQLDPNHPKIIKGEIQLTGTNNKEEEINVSLPALGINENFTTNKQGYVSFKIESDQIRYWNVDDPYLYDVHLKAREDQLTDQIGFRTIRTQKAKILLNGKPLFLKGISIHEESPFRGGRAHSLKDAKQLLNWAKALGCNYVRLAHYPHNEHMLRLADQMGILVWEENPVYWTIDWENENTFANAKQQLSSLIQRDKNRASVIIWSMANETPTNAARNHFLERLATYTKTKDPTRLISAALEQSNYNGNPLIRTISDPFANQVDILSFNQYIGWYDGGIEKCQSIQWNIPQNKPVIISEFGAGAKFGLRGDKQDRWTEDYQAYLYEETLKMIDKIDQLSGVSPWILMDFKSPRRVLPEIQEGWNRKGLLSEKGEKKQAFYVLQEYYRSKH